MDNSDTLDTIEIKPVVNRYGLTLSLLGGVSALLSLVVIFLLTSIPKLPFYVMLGGSVFTLLLGLLKQLEPKVSLRLCPNYLQFYHRHGQWTLAWQDIQRIDIPTLGLEDNYQPLSYVGIRLTSQHRLLSNISLRLASRILLEQRPVLMQAIKNECADGTCPSELLFEGDQFTDDQGTHYTGLLAMLGQRMQRLREMLGYDIYLPENSLDRPAEEFIVLLRKYHSQVQQLDA
ncbi:MULTISPECIES: DUF2982 domain-containing protein [Corallincola]|uniref:DUF2982 domain-containing protein n=2 Tax=Corallincola TaxID=1775176 RepID=A0A368NHK2_9GAMM|nr:MULTISPECIES: DUF2982 domain-containing protein [Corallincola]RCU49215.1 DUF2982 domain-containing protein [Corallincola holothuriorum]TAA47485.1 DUF2982 domain-containing protein [Corallincola spongiicola]